MKIIEVVDGNEKLHASLMEIEPNKREAKTSTG